MEKEINAVVVNFIKTRKKGGKITNWHYPKPYIFKIFPKYAKEVTVGTKLFVKNKKEQIVPVIVKELVSLPYKERKKCKAIQKCDQNKRW